MGSNCYEDSTYKDVIVEINNTYDIDNIDDDKEIVIEDEKFIYYKEELECLRKLNVIDRDTNILDRIRYAILRNYIKRHSTIDGIDGTEIIEVVKDIEKQGYNNKEFTLRFKDFNISDNIPHRYRFYSYNRLDIWSLFMYCGEPLYRGIYGIKLNPKLTDNIEKKLVYNQRILQGNNGKTIELTGHQKRLSELLFSSEHIREYTRGKAETFVYGREFEAGNQIKSLVTQVNLKGKKVGYEDNILSYKDESVIRNIPIYI